MLRKQISERLGIGLIHSDLIPIRNFARFLSAMIFLNTDEPKNDIDIGNTGSPKIHGKSKKYPRSA